MTKHIAGFIIFTFIVGSAVLFSAAIGSSVPVTVKGDYNVPFTVKGDDYHVTKKKKKKRKRHHCDGFRRKMDRVTLENVVFDAGNGLFSARLSDAYSNEAGYVDLHFYANDKFGPRFLKTERFAYTGADVIYSKELRWMKSLDAEQFVYVIAAKSNGWGDETIPPTFDESKSVPVAIK